jgi:hypothetical protein
VPVALSNSFEKLSSAAVGTDESLAHNLVDARAHGPASGAHTATASEQEQLSSRAAYEKVSSGTAGAMPSAASTGTSVESTADTSPHRASADGNEGYRGLQSPRASDPATAGQLSLAHVQEGASEVSSTAADAMHAAGKATRQAVDKAKESAAQTVAEVSQVLKNAGPETQASLADAVRALSNATAAATAPFRNISGRKIHGMDVPQTSLSARGGSVSEGDTIASDATLTDVLAFAGDENQGFVTSGHVSRVSKEAATDALGSCSGKAASRIGDAFSETHTTLVRSGFRSGGAVASVQDATKSSAGSSVSVVSTASAHGAGKSITGSFMSGDNGDNAASNGVTTQDRVAANVPANSFASADHKDSSEGRANSIRSLFRPGAEPTSDKRAKELTAGGANAKINLLSTNGAAATDEVASSSGDTGNLLQQTSAKSQSDNGLKMPSTASHFGAATTNALLNGSTSTGRSSLAAGDNAAPGTAHGSSDERGQHAGPGSTARSTDGSNEGACIDSAVGTQSRAHRESLERGLSGEPSSHKRSTVSSKSGMAVPLSTAASGSSESGKSHGSKLDGHALDDRMSSIAVGGNRDGSHEDGCSSQDLGTGSSFSRDSDAHSGGSLVTGFGPGVGKVGRAEKFQGDGTGNVTGGTGAMGRGRDDDSGRDGSAGMGGGRSGGGGTGGGRGGDGGGDADKGPGGYGHFGWFLGILGVAAAGAYLSKHAHNTTREADMKGMPRDSRTVLHAVPDTGAGTPRDRRSAIGAHDVMAASVDAAHTAQQALSSSAAEAKKDFKRSQKV